MTEYSEKRIREQARFRGIFDKDTYKNGKFKRKIPLLQTETYAECREYVNEALDAGLDGTQIKLAEAELSKFMGLTHAVAVNSEKTVKPAYAQHSSSHAVVVNSEEAVKLASAYHLPLMHAVAVNSGEAAMRLALKLAAEKLYGSSTGIYTPNGLGNGGALHGKKVFCPDLTTVNVVNPVVFESGEPVFIDSTDEGFGLAMSPEVLEMAFRKYPDVKIVILDHVYGFPGDAVSIRKICFAHGALLIECVGDALGAEYMVPQGKIGAYGTEYRVQTPQSRADVKDVEYHAPQDRSGTYGTEYRLRMSRDRTDMPCVPQDRPGGIWCRAGTLGDYCVLDFGRMFGSAGGAVLTHSRYGAEKAKYWASGAKAATPWNQYEELGHDCLMGDLGAAMLRGRLAHIGETMKKKKAIYEKYLEKLDGSLASVIPVGEGTKPNCWMTCMTSESGIQFMETRNDRNYTYQNIHGTAAPMEIYDVLRAFGAECATVYKPMSMQPVYRNCEHFTLDGPWRMYENFYNDTFMLRCDVARGYYESGIVLPSDAGMTEDGQDGIIDVIHACYGQRNINRLAWAD